MRSLQSVGWSRSWGRMRCGGRRACGLAMLAGSKHVTPGGALRTATSMLEATDDGQSLAWCRSVRFIAYQAFECQAPDP